MSKLLQLLGVEPVTVDAVKLAARVDGSELDSDIATAIAAARQTAEQLTGRLYRPAVMRESLADWPALCEAISVHQASACAISYWTGSAWATLSPAAYVFAAGGIGDTGTILAPALGTSWPTLGQIAAGPRVRIDLTAGPVITEGAPDTQAPVPECVQLYIKAFAAAWLATPAAQRVQQALTPNPLFACLLDSERLWA